MLTRAGFGDDPGLAHASRQQDLAEGVIDFVCAGVQKIFALEIDARAAGVFSQTPREEERRRPPCVIAPQRIELILKILIPARSFIGRRQFFQRGHQSLGHEAPAVTAPVAKRIRLSDC